MKFSGVMFTALLRLKWPWKFWMTGQHRRSFKQDLKWNESWKAIVYNCKFHRERSESRVRREAKVIKANTWVTFLYNSWKLFVSVEFNYLLFLHSSMRLTHTLIWLLTSIGQFILNSAFIFTLWDVYFKELRIRSWSCFFVHYFRVPQVHRVLRVSLELQDPL